MIFGLALYNLEASQLYNLSSILENSIKGSEPYHIYSIITLSVSSKLSLDPSLIILGIVAALVPFSKLILNFNSNYFPDLIKDRFFPTWGEGTSPGASYIGQFYAAFGYSGIIIASISILLFSTILIILIRKSSSRFNTSFLYLSLSYATFYVYRNSSEQIIAHFKKTFVCWLVALALIKMITLTRNSLKAISK